MSTPPIAMIGADRHGRVIAAAQHVRDERLSRAWRVVAMVEPEQGGDRIPFLAWSTATTDSRTRDIREIARSIRVADRL